MPLVTLPDYDYYDLVNLDHEFAQVLVSWWKVMPGWYGGTVWYDLMKRNNATLNNVAIPYSSTSGMVLGSTRPGGDGEMRFDGTDDYGRSPWAASITSAIFTIACWATLRSLTNCRFYDFQDASSSFQLVYNTSLSLVRTKHSQWQSADTSTGWFTPTTNTPSYIICQVDSGSSTIRLWLNGVEQTGTAATTVTASTTRNTVTLGARGDVLGFFPGSLDDLMFISGAVDAVALYQSSLLGHPGLLRRRVYRYISIPSGAVTPPKRIIGGGLLPMVV